MDDDDPLDIPPFLDRLTTKEIINSGDAGDQIVPNASSPEETEKIRASEMQPHPYADVFPRMQGEDFASLVTSIREDGLEEPIVTYKGEILDGRNRFAACTEAEIEPAFIEYEGMDPLGFVLRKNLHRRQLQISQRAMIAAKMANLKQGGDHKSEDFKASNDGLKIEDAAQILRVSPKTIERAKTVLAGGDDELIARVESGEMSVSAAAKQVTQATTPPSKPTGTPLTEAEEQCQRLLKLWDKTGEEGRKLFSEAIGAST